MRILVIDDDEKFANEQCKWLEGHGYETLVALSEAEAKKLLAKKPREIDIALIDMFMQSKTSGLNLIRLIRSEYPWIVPIVVTAYGDLKNAAMCMEAGSFSYIAKGEFPPKLILEIIKRADAQHRVVTGLPRILKGFTELLKQLGRLKTEIDRLSPLLGRIEEEFDWLGRK